MSRDNVVYTTCGLLLGLIVGSFLIGPKLARSKLAGSNAIAATAAAPSGDAGGASDAGSIAAPTQNAAPMAAVREQIDTLKKRIAANANDFEALVQLANLYMDAAKYPQAIDYYSRALAVREEPNVRTDLGICYKQSGKSDEALAAFKQVSEESPASWQAIYNLAIMYGELHRFDDARVELAKLKQLRPSDPDVAKLEAALLQAK
jgi:tetratricopeptide (TPR) repeat protein